MDLHFALSPPAGFTTQKNFGRYTHKLPEIYSLDAERHLGDRLSSILVACPIQLELNLPMDESAQIGNWITAGPGLLPLSPPWHWAGLPRLSNDQRVGWSFIVRALSRNNPTFQKQALNASVGINLVIHSDVGRLTFHPIDYPWRAPVHTSV